MANAEDPKDSFDQRYDALVSPPETVGEQQGAEVTPTEQTVEVPASTGEVQKTQEQVQKPETDKGFANHPAWQEREAKLKEARTLLEQERANAQRYAKLLDEATKRQDTNRPVGDKQAQALSIAEQVCALKKWDINRLNADQRAIVEDQIELALGVFEIQSKQQQAQLDQRLAPLEQAQHRWEAEQTMAKAESKWSALAKEDKLDDKVVQAAINKYCLDLDQTDPERKIKLSDEDLYYRATRPLLREKEISLARQDARNDVKGNARPLGKTPSSAVVPGKNIAKKDEGAYLDKLLDEAGVKN